MHSLHEEGEQQKHFANYNINTEPIVINQINNITNIYNSEKSIKDKSVINSSNNERKVDIDSNEISENIKDSKDSKDYKCIKHSKDSKDTIENTHNQIEKDQTIENINKNINSKVKKVNISEKIIVNEKFNLGSTN